MDKIILIKSFLTGVLYDCFKDIFANVIAVWKWWYRPIIGSFAIFIIKRASLKRLYLYIKLLRSSTIFKQRNNHEVSCDQDFCVKIFTTPNSKNIGTTLRLVTIEQPELAFLLILYFHVPFNTGLLTHFGVNCTIPWHRRASFWSSQSFLKFLKRTAR